MKIMKLIAAVIMLCLLPAFSFCSNPFKDGNKNYLSGDYAKALEGYSKFIKDKPDFFEGYYNAGNAMFRQEQYEDALKMYNKALEINPKDEDTKINIQVTQDKLKEQEKNKDKKGGKNNKDNKDNKQGKDKQDQKGGQGKGKDGKSQEQKGQQPGGTQQNSSGAGAGKGKPAEKADPQKQLGMSADEVQALMNMMQKSEKDYKNYFGKQYRHKQDQNDFPNVFNMSPEEIHNYMLRRMMEPDNMQQAPPKQDSKEKDW